MAGWGTLAAAPVALGVGEAAGAAIEPVLEPLRQDAWKKQAPRVLDVGVLAALVAQGGVLLGDSDGTTPGSAYEQARRTGFNASNLERLIYLAQTAPDLALTLELWRRGLFGDVQGTTALGLVEHAFAKHQIEPQYWPFLEELFNGRLDPALVATMVQRSVLANASNAAGTDTLLPFDVTAASTAIFNEWDAILQNQLGTGATDGHAVTPMPQVGLDPLLEAQAHGIDFERLAAEARIVGLPASPDLAARMVFRGIITPKDFAQAAAEGNTRIEWAPALFEGFREILTAREYAELQRRGVYDRPTRLKGTLKHGMAEDDSDNLFFLTGHTPSIHQVLIGLRRGGKYPSTYADVPEPYRTAIIQEGVREDWANVAYSARNAYPSGFQIRAEAQAGNLSESDTEAILLEIGWTDEWAKFFATKWTGGTTAAATDPHVKKAQTTLFTEAHKAYVKNGLSQEQVAPALTELDVPADAQAEVFKLWDAEIQLASDTPPAA